MKQRGLSHKIRKLGDVDSCSEINTRKVIRHPAIPKIPNKNASKTLVILCLNISRKEMTKIIKNMNQQIKRGDKRKGVGPRGSASGFSSPIIIVSLTSFSPSGEPIVASLAISSNITGAKDASLLLIL